MNEHGTDRPITKEQVSDLFGWISRTILMFVQKLEFKQAKWLLSHKKQLADAICDAIRSLVGNVGDYSQLLTDWQDFYREVFGIEADFSGVVIPEKPEGFDRLLIIDDRMTPDRAYGMCAGTFPSWKWTDRDLNEVVTSDRTAENGAYAIWMRDRVEADEELKNLSANQLKERNISGITLEERLIYELKYFKETGKHLDIKNVTLCSGSRYDAGSVPDVYFFPNTGEVHVYYYHPAHHDDLLRSRQAVSA